MLTITPLMNPRPHTQGKHANHYTTDEPTTYHTQGKHANHYTTDEPTLKGSMLTITPLMQSASDKKQKATINKF